MSRRFDPSSYTRFETLQYQSATPDRIEFLTDTHIPFYVQVPASGIFRLSFGSPQVSSPSENTSKLAKHSSATISSETEGLLLASGEPYEELTLACTLDGGWLIIQGNSALEILPCPLRIRLWLHGKLVLASSGDSGYGTETDILGFGIKTESPKSNSTASPRLGEVSWIASFALDKVLGPIQPVYSPLAVGLPEPKLTEQEDTFSVETDAIYGLGLKTPSALQALSTPDYQALSLDTALPFSWSPSGWGLYAHSFCASQHYISKDAEGWQSYLVETQAPQLDLFLFVGEPADIFNQYTLVTGKPLMPPAWSLGLALTGVKIQRSPEHPISQDIKRIREAGLQFDSIVLPGALPWTLAIRHGIQWQTPAAEASPHANTPLSPKMILLSLRSQGLRVSIDTHPEIHTEHPLYEEFQDRDWLIMPAANQSSPALLNLNRDDVFNYWRDRQKSLFDDGVDGFLLDSVNLDLIPDLRRQTSYQIALQRSLQEAAQQFKTPAECILWSGAVYSSCQRSALLTLGNKPSADLVTSQVDSVWLTLEQNLLNALQASMCGIASVTYSISDFAGNSLSQEQKADLLLRGLILSTFIPHVQISVSPDSPLWQLTEAQQLVVKQWMAFRYRLVPYLLGALEEANRSGVPVLRSMPFAYPKDTFAHQYPLQFMCGPALLVAPVVGAKQQLEVYLPQGDAWWDLSTGQRFEGGERYLFSTENYATPVFGREGHILCLGPTAKNTTEFNTARMLEESWLFGMPTANPCVMRNKIRIMQMQGSSYAKGLEGLRILPSEGLEVKRRGAEVRISRAR